MDYQSVRKYYDETSVEKNDLAASPFTQLKLWLNEAIETKVQEPNAMIIATATKKGTPSSRTVLLKGLSDEGLVFFTNYESRKSKEILENPQVSLTFLWKELQKQVLVEGIAERLSKKASALYFSQRPRGSQIAAWASKQDQPLQNREMLMNQFEEMLKKYPNEVPLPPFWGGFLITPHRFEFWKGRKDRLHDRFCYEQKQQEWMIQRLSP